MTWSKRGFDIALALLGVVIFVIPGLLIVGVLLFSQGRPIFYVSERMKTPQQAFQLWKFRTMHRAVDDAGVSGGDKVARITRFGQTLRRTRLDELPQLWNILCGEISFVGPRPPLRHYVERYPQLYDQVLQNRPGLTGLATLICHGREERLLAACRTPHETDAVYTARCLPRKAQIDLIYQRNQNFKLDTYVMGKTILQVISKPGRA